MFLANDRSRSNVDTAELFEKFFKSSFNYITVDSIDLVGLRKFSYFNDRRSNSYK